MQFSKSAALLSVLSTVALAVPADMACDQNPYYTFTQTVEPTLCPLISCLEPTGSNTFCSSTITSTKTFPPSGPCPTPTTTVTGTCDVDCYDCKTVYNSVTGCYTSTVTQTTSTPEVCPLAACVVPTEECTTTSTVTETPPAGSVCQTTPTITVEVAATCTGIDCPTCTGGPTTTVGWYS